MVGTSEVPTSKTESSLAEQGAELQADELALTQVESEAMKWITGVQAKNKEMETRVEARQGEESEAQQMKQQKEQAEARATQQEEALVEQMEKLEARAAARTQAEQLKSLRLELQHEPRGEFDAHAEAQALQRVAELQQRVR